MKIIVVPRALDLVNAIQFTRELDQLKDQAHFVFDFKNLGRVEPFTMLIVASQIKRLRERFSSSKFECTNFRSKSYAGHMGFFKAFGLDYGNSPGEAKGSDNYIPLTLYNCESIEKEAAEEGKYVGDIIEAQSQTLAKILCKKASGEVHETLSYSLREIMRNVVEHSDAERFGVCAQSWPSKKLVEFAIVDRGKGLNESLSKNPHLDIADDKSAINYALMPAVSGRAFKGAPKQRQGHWSNSGFGLYMTSRIARNGGNFFIASGKTGMLLTSKGGKRYFDCSLSGTAVRMVMKTEDMSELSKALQQYRKEGKEIQETYKEIINIDPSSASLMLSKDFDLSVWQKILKNLRGL